MNYFAVLILVLLISFAYIVYSIKCAKPVDKDDETF